MTTLAEKCAELADAFDSECKRELIDAALDTADDMARLLRQLSELLGQDGLPELPEPHVRELEPYGKPTGFRDWQLREYAEAARAPLLARIAELEKVALDSYVDEKGTVWNVPTAWAYFAACRALDEHKARIAELEAERNQHVQR